MDIIRSKRGMMAQIAQELGLTRAAVVTWDRVPAERVVAVEQITGIPREQLRPDLYRVATPSPDGDVLPGTSSPADAVSHATPSVAPARAITACES